MYTVPAFYHVCPPCSGNFEVPGWDQPLVSVFRLLSSACDLMAKQTRWWIEGQSGCVMAEMFWSESLGIQRD